MTSVIAAKGLTKHYGKFCSVNNVSFEIPSGRIVGLIGPNGSGKNHNSEIHSRPDSV